VITILALITVIAHLLMKNWAGLTAAQTPSEKPQTAKGVGSVAPTEGAANVPVAANIEATFFEAMDPNTLTAGTFTLTKLGSANPIAATVSPNASKDKATLNPNADLEAGATYTAIVRAGNEGVKNLAGNPLPADKRWSFATTPAPASQTPSAVTGITSVAPLEGATGVNITDNIEVAFSGDMDPATITPDNFFLTKEGTNERVEAAPPTYGPASKKAILDPVKELEKGAIYTATLLRGVKTSAGNALPADKKWSFATAPSERLASSPPTINSFEPTKEAKAVPVTTNIEATFSDDIDPSTITAETFTLSKKRDKSHTVKVDATVTYEPVSKKATLNPDADLEAGATYTATLKEDKVKNLAGVPLSKDETSEFTTLRNLGFWKLFVGLDGRGSVSKTQLMVWTYAFFFAVLWLLIFRPGDFEQHWANVQPEYLILLGSPAAAALLAKKFTSDHVEDDTVVQTPASEPAKLQTAATETITTNDGQADLFNFQYVLFNLLAIGFFFSHFLFHPGKGLPDLPETLVALTGLSAAGYVAKKGWETSGIPSVSSVTPSLLLFGKDNQISINGVNFGDPSKETPPQNNVLLQGRPLSTVSHWDSQRIVATIPRNPAELGIAVPAGAASNSATLEVQDRFGRKSGTTNVTVALATPTVSVINPVNGATGIATSTVVEATFSEEMDRASVEARGAFTLVQEGASAPLDAPVTYDPAYSRATLRPPALTAGTTYTATIRGGVDGAKNLAGSQLAADRAWKFTTAP
jgi:hypothetical protein